MSSGSYKQVQVLCPFYQYDDGKGRIMCEGIADYSNVALIFHRKAEYEKQIGIFCCDHYQNCEIYRAIMDSKYNG